MTAAPKWIAPLAIAIAVATTSAAHAASPVSVGHAGWFWGDPQPQGTTLSDLAFAGSRGYAVGREGTVLRTDDAGATWTGLGAGTYEDLYSVTTVGPNTVIAGGDCTLRRSDDAGARFRRLPVTASDERCPSYVSAASFPSSQLGYVLLANGTVLRTTDGGRTFGQRTAVPGGAAGSGASGNATAMTFTSPDVGVAAAGGQVYRTTNGGGSWTAVTASGTRANALEFVDATHVMAVGDGGTFLRSDDAGASFTAQPLTGQGAGKSFTRVGCADAQTCVMPAGGNALVRTTDGGATSSLVTPSDQAIYGAAFASPGRVVGVGNAGTTVVSGDAGATFQAVGSHLPQEFGAIRSAFGARAYALGANGKVARTQDGGASWSVFGAPTGFTVADLSFPTPAAGFALDDQGALFGTSNAGESWRILDPGVTGKAKALVATSPARVAVIGPRGVRRSRNGGQSFGSSRSAAVRRASLRAADVAGRSIFAWGDRRLARSDDGGSRWSKVRTPRAGFVVMRGGALYATRDGGRHWSPRTAVGGPVARVAFGDARHGFARVGSSNLLRTDDGGRTWAPQALTSGSLAGLAASGPRIGYASGLSGALFGTTTGGRLARASRIALRVSKRRLRRAATVRVFGRVRPASPGSLVDVTMRRGKRYATKSAVIASNGSFSASFRVRHSATFVAQWAGDGRLDGDGTAEVRVRVGRR